MNLTEYIDSLLEADPDKNFVIAEKSDLEDLRNELDHLELFASEIENSVFLIKGFADCIDSLSERQRIYLNLLLDQLTIYQTAIMDTISDSY